MDRQKYYQKYVGRRFRRYGAIFIIRSVYRDERNKLYYFHCTRIGNEASNAYKSYRVVGWNDWVDDKFDQYKANLLKE